MAELEQAELYEVLHKSDEKHGIHLSDGENDAWFTVVGAAREFLPKIVKGDVVEVTFKDGQVTFVKKTDAKTSTLKKAEFVSGADLNSEHPAFLGMCMNQAFELALKLKEEQKLTMDGFWLTYENLIKKVVELNRKIRKETGGK